MSRFVRASSRENMYSSCSSAVENLGLYFVMFLCPKMQITSKLYFHEMPPCAAGMQLFLFS